jgi:hypothetical protein
MTSIVVPAPFFVVPAPFFVVPAKAGTPFVFDLLILMF